MLGLAGTGPQGQEATVRIARRGKPMAEIVPPSVVEDRTSWIGSMQGSGETLGDIISPATDEDDCEVLRD